MPKEADLTRAFLAYVSACLDEGDTSALREIGFSERQAHVVNQLSLAQIKGLAQKIQLRLDLDTKAFWELLEQISDQGQLEQMKSELLRRGAPFEMMQQVFGMGSRQYTKLRKRLAAPAGVGRPRGADEEDVRALWLAWERIVGDAQPKAAQWLRLADETGMPVRAIWALGQGWTQTCDEDHCEDQPQPVIRVETPSTAQAAAES